MLITLCYIYLWVRFQKFYTPVIRRTVYRLCGGSKLSSSFTFCAVRSDQCQTGDQSSRRRKSTVPEDNQVFLKLGNKAIYITEPQAVKWSDYCHPLACSPGDPYRAVAEASVDDFSCLGVAFLEDRLQMENGLIPEKIVSVLLQESTLKELIEKSKSVTGTNADQQVHHQQKQQQQQQHLLLTADTSIVLSEPSPREELGDSLLPQATEVSLPSLPPTPYSSRKSSLNPSSLALDSAGRRGSGGEGSADSQGGHHHMDGHHHLHLSSCHECLELEHSTILSVKYASIENIPDLPHDDITSSDDDEYVDTYDGEEGLDGLERFAGQSKRVNVTGKPPNVLVYTGSEGERFEPIQRLLSECIDTESYTLYPLKPQQALSEPWLESTMLLVLAAEEPLTPQLQERFLAYLEKGGKVLGLSSTFSPAGLTLVGRDGQRGHICRLSFTKADSTELELSVLGSGAAYVREPADSATGEVELWGELCADVAGDNNKDMVIVRVTHGGRGGEAILCQVRLETAPDAQHVQSPSHFDVLKMSNALRYEVLTEILTSLGLSCELSQIPPPSPVHILSTCPELKGRFLKWLESQADEDGTVGSPKRRMKLLLPGVVTPQTAEREGEGEGESEGDGESESSELPEGVLALRPQTPPELLSEQFNLPAYSQHLQTRTLGRTLLFAEVTPTTMDLLEGLMLDVPEEMGLIAVALRQTQGRGRGGNAWLSPLGCAMFTLHVRVPIASRLGQRIPFLQHLAALAVVEAVCTLPGYEELDLRVKWPNDIYYSNLMKVGGVLVNSTVMGSTFHLLIGCGFNVSNSNPTICINDLVVQRNREHGCRLEPLTPAQLIGRTVTHLEGLIQDFQQQGPSAVLPLYYKRWVHSGTRVKLWSEDGPEAEVLGLDEHGFLQVKSEKEVVSVQPDGNSFDMLRNLVVTKHS
ncbi:biotin--protein ligase isoform X2 [Engraulis encrasicolus]|uniref:biotin--protein ligase isoform X2 n=1 Tax=Engraulis encrasicolus TaxID=184585 RepID=UPI002FD2F490